MAQAVPIYIVGLCILSAGHDCKINYSPQLPALGTPTHV